MFDPGESGLRNHFVDLAKRFGLNSKDPVDFQKIFDRIGEVLRKGDVRPTETGFRFDYLFADGRSVRAFVDRVGNRYRLVTAFPT
jgi:hypothetical protein